MQLVVHTQGMAANIYEELLFVKHSKGWPNTARNLNSVKTWANLCTIYKIRLARELFVTIPSVNDELHWKAFAKKYKIVLKAESLILRSP